MIDFLSGGNCKRIVPTGFENIITKKQDAIIDMTMDVITAPGPGSPNKEERITFQLKYNTDSNSSPKSFEAEFLTHSRMTQYSVYKVCSDMKTDKMLDLCICDIENAAKMRRTARTITNKQTQLLNLYPSRNAYTYEIKGDDLYVEETITHIVEDHLGLLKREVFEEFDKNDLCSVTFELINYSLSRTFEVNITFTNLDDMKPLQESRCQGVAKPQSMRYLCTVSRSKLSGNGILNDYKLDFKELQDLNP